MSVAENFRAFRTAYIVPSDTVSSISARYRRITRQLNSDFWDSTSETSHSFYVGSYGRDTAAKGVSDLDVAFALPANLYHTYDAYSSNGQSAMLQAVRASLQKTYPSSQVGGDGQVVAINFTDNITFELLPVFHNQQNTYTFADSNGGGSWKTCNPRAEMSAFAARNTEVNGNLKAVSRMARIWKRYNGLSISGMLLDTLAYQFINTWTHKDKSFLYHDFLARDFFLFLANIPADKTYWTAPGSGSYVYKKGSIRQPGRAAYDLAVSAINYETNDRPETARNKWREIFGPTYP